MSKIIRFPIERARPELKYLDGEVETEQQLYEALLSNNLPQIFNIMTAFEEEDDKRG